MLGVPAGDRAPFRRYSLAILGALEPVAGPERQAAGNAAVGRVLGLSRRADRRTAQAARRRSRRAGHADPWRGRRRAADARRAGAELHLPAERRPRDDDQPDRQHRRCAAALSRRTAAAAREARPVAGAASRRGCASRAPTSSATAALPTDIEIGGERLAAGTYIHIGIGAANRDPAQFPDPDRFDAGRDPNRHLAFGSGVHMCLGAVLARMEGTIAVGRLVRRFDGLARDGAFERGGRARFRGFNRYPIAWAARLTRPLPSLRWARPRGRSPGPWRRHRARRTRSPPWVRHRRSGSRP